MEEEQQVDETTTSSEELDLEVQDNVEDIEAIKAELERERQARIEITARAKRAEAEARTLKQKTAEAPQNINNQSLSAEDVDIKILISQGVGEDHIEYLKKLAKVNGTSILAAQSDPIYLGFKREKEAEKKSQEASLGASRGSGQSKKGKSFQTPDLPSQDHRELWNKQMGR